MENPKENKPTGNHPPPPIAALNGDFTWPELSSSGELSTLNTFPITIVSVPTTPESSPPPNIHHNAAVTVTTTTKTTSETEERGIQNGGGKSKGSGSAMECLVRVLEGLYGVKGEIEEVDLVDSFKRKGLSFP